MMTQPAKYSMEMASSVWHVVQPCSSRMSSNSCCRKNQQQSLGTRVRQCLQEATASNTSSSSRQGSSSGAICCHAGRCCLLSPRAVQATPAWMPCLGACWCLPSPAPAVGMCQLHMSRSWTYLCRFHCQAVAASVGRWVVQNAGRYCCTCTWSRPGVSCCTAFCQQSCM